MNTNIFSGKKAIIFDFDGTIADTFRLHESAFQTALQEYSLAFNYGDYAGRSTDAAIRMIFEQNQTALPEEELKRLVALKRKLANQLYTQEIDFIPGASQFIKSMWSRGLHLFIGSSGSRMNITTGVEALGIGKYLTDILTADDVKRSKPDPEIFNSILTRHHIDAQQALVVEDAIAGIRAAEAANIDVICVDKSVFPDPACKVSFLSANFSELTELLMKETHA